MINILLFCSLLCAETLPDLGTYSDANKDFKPTPVFEESFDGDLVGWSHPAAFIDTAARKIFCSDTFKYYYPARVIARTMRANGRNAVLIVSNGPGEVAAELEIPGAPDLKSKYGRTQNMGNGKYLFTGKDIASDVLL